jgi:hypothetical protein
MFGAVKNRCSGRQSALVEMGSATVPVAAFGVPPNALHFGCLEFGSFSGAWMLGFGCYETLTIPSTTLPVLTNPQPKSRAASPKLTLDLPLPC